MAIWRARVLTDEGERLQEEGLGADLADALLPGLADDGVLALVGELGEAFGDRGVVACVQGREVVGLP